MLKELNNNKELRYAEIVGRKRIVDDVVPIWTVKKMPKKPMKRLGTDDEYRKLFPNHIEVDKKKWGNDDYSLFQLKQAGLVERTGRGVYKITSKGKKAFTSASKRREFE
jgi:hypothetical protein